MRRFLRIVAAALALCAGSAPALAQGQLKIGVGFGLAFLPIYICEDLKLIEKHGKDAHLELKAEFQRFTSAADVQGAIAAGAVDIAPFGPAPLLAAWQQGKDKPRQILVVSGMTSLPLVLLSNQPGVKTIADFKPADEIAMPTLSSPQMYLLELQSEKSFGQYDKLRGQVVALPHAQAISDLVERSGPVKAYFSSPPFTQIALRDPNVHAVLNSSEVMGGKSSFLILGATRAYIDAHPQLPEVIEKAIDEAARIVHDDPRRAAQIYLTHEPSSVINGAAMEAVIREIKDEFGSPVFGMQTTADFMGRHGELKTVPKSWKEVVAPALLNSPSS